MITVSDSFISKIRSRHQRHVYVKIEIYDSQMRYITEVTNKISRDNMGSISVDGNRDIRRSFTFTLINKKNEFDWGDQNLIWIDKRIKLFIGLKLSNGSIEYIPQGVFILTSPSSEHSTNGNLVEITGQDKSYLYTGNIGKFTYQTTLQAYLPIKDAIRIIAQGNGETMFNFDEDITEVVPYEMTFEANSSRWDAMKELAQFGKASISFDVNGYLTLKKIDLNTLQNQSPVWSFVYGDSDENLYAGNVRKLNPNQLYNDFITLGGSSQTATVRHQLTVTEADELWKDSPYSIERIGRRTYFHNSGNPDPLITTQSEALWRNKYSLMQYLGYQEDVEIQIAPLYMLDVDDVIEIHDSTNSVNGRFMVNSLNIPLSPQLMSVGCIKEHRVVKDWNFIPS